MTRYALLRGSVAYFASSAQDQLGHEWGADDAVSETPYPLEDMFDCGEITLAEINVVRPLATLIEQYAGSPGLKVWHDEALLFSDPAWAEIRTMAIAALERLTGHDRGAADL